MTGGGLKCSKRQPGIIWMWRGSDPSRLDVAYFDTRGSLGHYLEFIKMNEVMADLMEIVPES